MVGDVIMSFLADICGEGSDEDSSPKHADAFGNIGRLHRQIHNERVIALSKFQKDVISSNFRYQQNNISMHIGEKEEFLESLDKWIPIYQ